MKLEVKIGNTWCECFHVDVEQEEVFVAAEEFHKRKGEETRRVDDKIRKRSHWKTKRLNENTLVTYYEKPPRRKDRKGAKPSDIR